MTCCNSRALRVQDELELVRFATIDGMKLNHAQKNAKKDVSEKTGSCFDAKVPSSVFPEDFERVKRLILDPRGPAAGKWKKIFFAAGLVSLFVDPLFFYLPVSQPDLCFQTDITLQRILTIVRTLYDVFYIIHIVVQFRTAFVAPSSRVLGRGELVVDTRKIAHRYLAKDFWVDFTAAIPLPQVLVWAIIPSAEGVTSYSRIVLRFILMFQYILRFVIISPLSSQIVNDTGVLGTEKAWVGAAYNMMLYLLAAHVSGACYYLLTIDRQELCWKTVCNQETSCEYGFFDCHNIGYAGRSDWLYSTNVTTICNAGTLNSPSNASYWGIYQISVINGATSSSFLHQYFFCLWIGLQALSSIGQTYTPSIFLGENIYCIANSTVGLILLALLISNMQSYLQSITARLEEWRLKRTDTEQWMHHRELPHELRDSVRKYGLFKWVATQGIDEEALLTSLPADLQREIKRHLCLNLVQQVPLLDKMDDRMLDAICERLRPAFCTESTFLLIEGDPVDEMFFIIRGRLDSYTTNGGRTGFFNSSSIGPGDFCGEELLTWALDQHHTDVLPTSTRTVKATSEVEAFRLAVEDLNFVASHFRLLHSRDLIHKFRFYSHQWRTWAACFIQAAWLRYKRRRSTNELGMNRASVSKEMNVFVPKPGAGLEVYAARLMNMRRAASSNHFETDSSEVGPLERPAEPEIDVDDE